ncbi:hypothetical protein FE634_05420 [Nocardioides dongxiaopingii]|uniref:hypothetical protein n=1 Tax=Nocardioides sp. S-1144 TaxID=2582905 RepID=UPI00110E63E0|nr:hypothetical protein [Nocardioides sp. S-1144]QCW49990.1 hypothetical protein FE634_05420 [Nocardioides sp. S-1144]
MSRTWSGRAVAALAVLVLGVAGCSGEPEVEEGRQVLSPAEAGQQHTHTTLVGDGTTADAGGYRLAELQFPDVSREPGDLTFRILDSRGDAVTDYVEEQTKLLHLYVVRDDLTDFRHLHPVLGDDGTWSARVDVADPGEYRVVAEFLPAAQEDGSHVVLGARALVEGTPPPTGQAPASTASDGVVTIAGPETLPAGVDSQFVMTVSDGASGVLNLGTYLGSYAHLTGFDVETGAFVHAHPIGAPTTTDAGSELTFHTSFDLPGTYRLFVQVRADGFVHTVPLTTIVG